MPGTFRAVSLLPAALLCLVLPGGRVGRVSAAPPCAGGRPGCHGLSLAHLLDRLVQHSARMHGLSNDLHAQFEQYFLPSKNHIGRIYCHTSSILTPNGKENAQRLAREELMEVILKLLVAWREPVWHLHQSVSRHANLSSDKALQISGMVHELHEGVERVAEKMQHMGIISNSVNGLSSLEDPLAAGGESRVMNDHDLLYCFRRDSNKVQNYLKILKCRVVPEHGC